MTTDELRVVRTDGESLIAEIDEAVAACRGNEKHVAMIVLITYMAALIIAMHRNVPRVTYINGARLQEVPEIPGSDRPFAVHREVRSFKSDGGKLKGGLD